MEHRWNVRTPVSLNVIVDSPGAGIIRGRTTDVSFGGMYVETAPSVAVDKNSVVDVSIPIVGQIHNAAALVVRTDPSGFGLMFTDFQLDTFNMLDTLFRRVRSTEQPATA
ncbi:MAG: PilZ domain-containing protein [Gammaproteobacteria bacterium]